MQLTEDEIHDINSECPNDWQKNEQGIYKEPYGIPIDVKGLVVYMRWVVGGVSGGSCWESSNPQPYTLNNNPRFKALDLVLKQLCPNITYIEYLEIIEELIQTNEKTRWEYYGNRTDFNIKYVELLDLYNYLKTKK